MSSRRALNSQSQNLLCPWPIRQLTARSDLFRYVVEAHETFALLKGNRFCMHQLTIGLHESAGLHESRCTQVGLNGGSVNGVVPVCLRASVRQLEVSTGLPDGIIH